jgi:hypothetical protein
MAAVPRIEIIALPAGQANRAENRFIIKFPASPPRWAGSNPIC